MKARSSGNGGPVSAGSVGVVPERDGEQRATVGDQAGDRVGGRLARRVREGLQGEDLDHEVERAAPLPRQREQVGDPEVDGGSRVPAPRDLDRGRGDVEGGGREAERGEVRRVGAQAAADHHGPPAGAVQPLALGPVPQLHLGLGAVPRHRDLAGGARGVQLSNHAVGSPRPIAPADSSSAR